MKFSMRRAFPAILLAALAAAWMACPTASRAGEPYQDALGRLQTDLAPHRHPISKWHMRKKKTPEEGAVGKAFDPDKWSDSRVGVIWSGAGQTAWFRQDFTMPAELNGAPLAGSKTIFHFTGAGIVTLFVDGRPVREFQDSGEALFAEKAEPGKVYTIAMKITPTESDRVGMMSDVFLTFDVLQKAKNRTDAFIAQMRSMEAMLDLVPEGERGRWKDLMNEAAGTIDFKAREEAREGDFLASLDRAGAALAPFGEVAKKYTMHLVGYSHIDLAWLWRYAEGKQVIKDTVNTIAELMEEYPDFTYTQTQAQAQKWMEEEHPEVYEKIHKWFDTGRFELSGGTWSEHDSNLPSGEGFVRQFLYGKRYFREKFNKDIVVAWTPDSFGYNWNLPQILKKSGMIGFLTQKISWNDTTRFPHNVFWWEGPDGSRMLTYFPTGGYGESVDPVTMVNQLKTLKAKHGLDENFVIFGIGDHGGGVTRGHLDRAEMIRNDPSYPKVEFTTGEKYFNHLQELAETREFPVWNDELYLQFHRGTYTTQAATKRNNREGEILLETAEKWSEIARPLGLSWPTDELMEGWEVVLLNHMHDILPGSGIRQVYEDTEKDYARMFEKGKSAMHRAMDRLSAEIDTRGEGRAIVLFNPLAWRRDDVAAIPMPALPENPAIVDDRGVPVATQIVEVSKGNMLTFVARDLPPMGYAVYRAIPNAAGKTAASPGLLKASNTELENERLKIALDPATGNIASLIDKASGRDLMKKGSEGGAALMLYEDNPKQYDAWEIALGNRIDLPVIEPPQLVESGPLRATVRTAYKAKGSTFEHYIRLYAGAGRVDGQLDVNWLSRHVMAKLAFNLDLHADKVWYEIPYAAIPRPAVPKTDEERAKHEVSGHKWVDYSNADGSYGFTLVNDSKYGYDVKEENMLRMSLLRGPGSPDPNADMGRHRIHYAVYPHEGDWRGADAPRRGIEFNYPVVWRLAESHAGRYPASRGFYEAGPDNVQLMVVKKAEDSDDTILRLYEAEGTDSTAVVRLPNPPKAVVETNLMEEPVEGGVPIAVRGDVIEVPIGHFEIKTLKVTW